MNSGIRTLFLTASVLASATVLSPAAAIATPMPKASRSASADCLAATQKAASAAVSARLTVLDGHTSAVNTDTTMTASDRSTLLSLYAKDTSGLTSLKQTINAATDCATAKTETQRIVTDYRIYVLVGPQTHLTEAVDAGLAGIVKMTSLEPVLKVTIAQAKAAGKNVTAAQSAYNDLLVQLPAASTALASGSGPVLALTPAGYPANKTTLQTTRSAVQTAGRALAKAVQDAETVLALSSSS
jgi:hypothetical protein